MEGEPKISTVEAILLVLIALLADAINWIPVVNWVVTLITLPAFQLYFILKKVRGLYALAGNLIEFIPILSILPGVTAGVVGVILLDRATAKKNALRGKLAPITKLRATSESASMKKAA
jgi:hypothetical protein